MGCRRYGGSMIELARRRMMMGGSAKPYDAEVKYLQTSGYSYIDTLVNPTQTINYEVDFTFLQPWENGGLFGAKNASTVSTITSNFCNSVYINNQGAIGCEDNGISLGDWDKLSNNSRHTILVQNRKYYFDGVLKRTSSSTTTYKFNSVTYGLLKFRLTNGYDKRRGFSARLHACKIWDGDMPIRDFIPVRVGNVGYMYDKVSGQLFGNQGTGQFIIGPDK